jgi:hypothetical protein
MFRSTALCVLVLPLWASQLRAQAAVEEDISDLALVLTVACDNLQRGADAGSVKTLLETTKDSLRGTPYRLVEHAAAQPDPKQALLGTPVPKPANKFRLAFLHPTEPRVAFVCDQGVVVIQDISDAAAKPVTVVTSRGKPLAYGSFSGDGRFFAVGDSEGGIVIWETQTWTEAKVIVKGTGVIRYVGLDKTGDHLLAEAESGLVLWNLADNHEIGVVGERFLFGSSFCFSDNQRHFATGGNASVVIHDIQTGKRVREIPHLAHTMHLCFSSDGRWIASGLRGVPANRSVGVFNVATGEPLIDRAEHGRGVTGVAFLDDDKCLVSTSADGAMRFWHVPSGTELLRLKLSDSIYQPSCHVRGSTILWNERGGPRFFRFGR